MVSDSLCWCQDGHPAIQTFCTNHHCDSGSNWLILVIARCAWNQNLCETLTMKSILEMKSCLAEFLQVGCYLSDVNRTSDASQSAVGQRQTTVTSVDALSADVSRQCAVEWPLHSCQLKLRLFHDVQHCFGCRSQNSRELQGL